jgi:glycosyltransferase involved in cell wall biosynthesis
VPYVLSPRGMLEPAALAHRRLRKRIAWSLVERATVDGASLLHATSEVEAETLAALHPRPPIVFVPNGVELPPATPRVAGEPVIVFLGRLHPIKRLDLLVDAFARVRSSGRRAELVIAGPDEGGLRPSLEARVPDAAGSITWPGALDDHSKHELLTRAAALVLCSESESFGLSAAEAMAAGVPVVVTRTCPWSDVERHGTGFWVEPTPEAIANALMRLLDYPGAARAMGASGKDLIERKYRWDVVAGRMEQEYRRLVGAAAARVA